MQRRRILVVDDQPDIRELTQTLLAGAGYEVLTAGSGREAVQAVAGNPFDLVLLDINMPEMDGWETLRLIRADELLERLPVVMFSVKGEFHDKVQSLQEGAVDYITKPFVVDDLLARIEQVLARGDVGMTAVDEYRERFLKLRSTLYDRATGLPAFPVLLDTLRAWLEVHRRIGVLSVSAENLEMVESLYGWQVFDRILAQLSFDLREARGRELPEDALLAVNGVAGGRLAVFIREQPDGREVDADYLGETAEQLQLRIQRAFKEERFAGLGPRLEIRTGQALLTHNPFYRFERRVYAAMEQAQQFDEKRRRTRLRSWNDELQRIIQDEAVHTVFQPVVDLQTHDILGHEALTRGPKDTLFERPRALFAMSSEVGISEDLDRRCRKVALRASTEVDHRGKVFLNALPSSAATEEWSTAFFRTQLEEARLQPGDLVIEFSDRGPGADEEEFVAGLVQLKRLGFGVALDDLGTGHASQALLEQTSPDYLKLDTSLVRDIDSNLIKQEVLHSLVRIAHRLGASVIAEGVETEAEAETLVQAGAQYGQGYLYAEPRPAGKLEH